MFNQSGEYYNSQTSIWPPITAQGLCMKFAELMLPVNIHRSPSISFNINLSSLTSNNYFATRDYQNFHALQSMSLRRKSPGIRYRLIPNPLASPLPPLFMRREVVD